MGEGHRATVAQAGRGLRALHGQLGWRASCSCGWTAEGDKGGMTAGLRAAKAHKRVMAMLVRVP
jgi:hypothetical protein